MQKAMVHMAYSTPAQFSSFYGAKMLLPECYVRRGKDSLLDRAAGKLALSNLLRKVGPLPNWLTGCTSS